MNTAIMIQNIARYLDAQTLLELGKLNKLFRKVVFLDEFWEPLLFFQFSSNLDIFGEILTGKDPIKPSYIKVSYFTLYKYATIKFNSILLLSGDCFFKDEAQQILCELSENLKNPMLSIPCLRREGKSFQTVVQDLIGNAFTEQLGSFSLPSQSEIIVQNLFQLEENLKNEYCHDKHFADFICTRWLIRKKFCKSKLLNRKNPMFLCKMARVIRDCFKAHCRIVKKKLSVIDNVHELLSEYCVQWEAYSANISVFEATFSPFCRIFTDLYDCVMPAKTRTPSYNMLRLMTITWRQQIFDWIFQSLLDGILFLIGKIRTAQKAVNKFDQNQYESDLVLVSRYILFRVVSFIVDFSGNELSLQFIDHSKFDCEDCYLMLEQKIERMTQQYYDDISKSPLSIAKSVLKTDYSLICRVFLNRTQAIIQKMMLQVLLMSYQNFYFPLFKEYSQFSIEDLPPEPAMYTSFGKMIFSNDHSSNSTKKIRNFFEYLKIKNLFGDVMEYNDIDAKLEEIKKGGNAKDQEIEYVNKGIGIQLEVTELEKLIFSFYKDLSFEIVEKL